MKTLGTIKRLAALALLVVMLMAVMPMQGILADGSITSGGQEFPFYYRHYGTGSEVSAFRLNVKFAPATITFTQTEGIADERSVFNWTSGKTEWGKYHIYYRVNDTTYRTDWDASFNSDTFKLYLNYTGEYLIWVVPFSNEEINDSYAVDHFECWKKVPRWTVVWDQQQCEWKSGTVTVNDIYVW